MLYGHGVLPTTIFQMAYLIFTFTFTSVIHSLTHSAFTFFKSPETIQALFLSCCKLSPLGMHSETIDTELFSQDRPN
uniref:Uncharacterized protein n=1 Tax=Anguilla anguilla TaxID=7936 RepID=A0A0E9RI85_ANGAN